MSIYGNKWGIYQCPGFSILGNIGMYDIKSNDFDSLIQGIERVHYTFPQWTMLSMDNIHRSKAAFCLLNNIAEHCVNSSHATFSAENQHGQCTRVIPRGYLFISVTYKRSALEILIIDSILFPAYPVPWSFAEFKGKSMEYLNQCTVAGKRRPAYVKIASPTNHAPKSMKKWCYSWLWPNIRWSFFYWFWWL